MNLQGLVTDYGYAAVFVGTFLEGETILALAGMAAHSGMLSLEWVIALAAVGGTLGDQAYFFIGRRYGDRLLARFPSFQARAERVHRLIERYHAPCIVLVRFMYGLRIAGPIVIGMTRVRAFRFVLFNASGATLWATLVAGAGYLFGEAVEYALDLAGHYQALALACVAGLAVAIGVVVHLVGRRLTQTKVPIALPGDSRAPGRD
jgi:membrane protein DedA with SNARE-associated domain